MAYLLDLLKNFRNKRFMVVRAGGNWGDHLIWQGFEDLANKMELVFHTVNEKDLMASLPSSEEIVYIHGNGGLNHLYHNDINALEVSLRSNARAIIMGPCTIGDDDYAQKLVRSGLRDVDPGRVSFILRESTSFQIAQRNFPSTVELGLNCDTAFYTNVSNLVARIGSLPGRYQLWALRQDREAIKAAGFLVSSGICLDPARYARSFDHWVRLHACAESVVTNRTHSAIMSCLLGKKTVMFAGSYHKNRSIWEYSLRDRDVQWMSTEFAPSCADTFPILRRLPSERVRNSHKLNKALAHFYGIPSS